MSIFRRIARYCGYFLLTLLIIVALWWVAAAIHGDDALDAGIEEFYHIDYTGYEKDNGALAMRGLGAPVGEKNSYGWAQKKIAKKFRERQEEDAQGHTFLELAKEWAKIYGFIDRTDYDTSPYLYYQGDDIWFKNSRHIISDCSATSYVDGDTSVHDNKSCNERSKVLKKLAQDNALLLSRYKQALKYTSYFEPDAVMLHGGNMMSLQQLMIEQLIESSKKDRERALQTWLENMEFYNRAVTGKVDLIDVSILICTRSIVQKALPAILSNDTALAKKYEKKLLATLRPIGAKDVQIIYEAKLLYNEASAIIKMTDHYNQNKLYRLHRDIVDAWNTPTTAKWKALETIQRDNHIIDWADWRSPISSLIMNWIIGGILVGADLNVAIDVTAARSTMLAVYVQLTAKHIKPKNMDAFLAKAPVSLHDSFTGKPFRYDEKQHMLYFVSPSERLKDGIKEGVMLSH